MDTWDFLSYFSDQNKLPFIDQKPHLTLNGVGKGEVTIHAPGEKLNKKPESTAYRDWEIVNCIIVL